MKYDVTFTLATTDDIRDLIEVQNKHFMMITSDTENAPDMGIHMKV